MRSALAGLRTLVLPWGASSSTPRIVLGPDIPATLAAIPFADISAAILFYFNATEYYFIATGTWSAVPTKIVLKGTYDAVNGITVYELHRPDFNEMAFGTTAFDSNHPDINFTDVSLNLGGTADLNLLASSLTTIQSGAEITAAGGGLISIDSGGLLSVVTGGDQKFDLISAARGYRSANSSNNGTLVTTSAEAAVPAASWDEEPTYTFVSDRIYQLDLQCGVYNSAATDSVARIRVRKGSASTTGQQLAFWQASPTSANIGSSSVGSFCGRAYVKNNSGSNVSTKLSLTIEKQSGAANVSLYGDADMPVTLVVRDIGDADEQIGQADVATEIA